MIKKISVYWSIPQADLLAGLDTRREGLTDEDAKRRLTTYGANLLNRWKTLFPEILFS